MAISRFKCVNCGGGTAALYKTYAPNVVKLAKCVRCNGIVDKYIEIDPVIVMIDLVLISKEAERHVLHNIKFQSYWKLLIILMMLETYGVWRNDSLFNIAINSMCALPSNNTNVEEFNSSDITSGLSKVIPEWWKTNCWAWMQDPKDDTDLFIWEKDFYIEFMATFAGIAAFIMTVQTIMKVVSPFLTMHKVTLEKLLKAFALADISIMCTIPMLVWGNIGTSTHTRTINYLLVHIYSYVMFLSVFNVLYECPMFVTIAAITMSNIVKYSTSFHVTPMLRSIIH